MQWPISARLTPLTGSGSTLLEIAAVLIALGISADLVTASILRRLSSVHLRHRRFQRRFHI
ncbi:hypothetical protein N657DRAFT_644009 [Parathielavia appendiculata]|uniref:Uncharacterized protein n=1 Tax=Parathielavia appendiculata TaxID=2587402 RepID=A0AAN6U2X6_9PEZI|nr:hypothetical protein N657DRAFT_644009 [Parathielavia appendiculata]